MDENSLKKLFDAIRQITGVLSQLQVNSTNSLLQSCVKHGITDNRWISYILATAIHESDLTPISEHESSRTGHSYNIPDPQTGQVYYGRGFIQLTHLTNYKHFTAILGIDLVHNPDKALELPVASEIAVIGMKNGSFTGVGLSRYFNDDRTDWVNARKIINSLDNAEKIAGYGQAVFKALDNSE